MREALFPVLGAVLAIGVLLPSSALVAKGLLWLLDRWDGAGLHASGTARYALLVGSSALPIAWLLSAGLHQAESLESLSACVLPHEREALCLEPAGFVATVSLLVAVRLLFHMAPWRARVSVDRTSRGARACARVRGLVEARPELAGLARRVAVVAAAEGHVATTGWFAPRVELSSDVVESMEDDALAATLMHELEHVRGLDPLRYGLLSCAVSLHPIGRWLLGREASRWILAREAHCDRVAVADGACALGLADAIVQVARPRAATAALGGGDARGIKMRVALLLAYADMRPTRCCEMSGLRALVLPLAATLLLPHFASTVLLDALHAWTEHIALLVLGG